MVPQLPLSDFAAWLSAQAVPPVVLDVREAWELQTASVRAQGFELRAMPMGEVPARLAELRRDTPLACLCLFWLPLLMLFIISAQN